MTDVALLRKDIEGASEDARFMAFLKLYDSKTPEATAEITRIMTVSDPVLKLMFLRFLGHVGDERAIVFICRMLEDENNVVVDAAERAFDRNQCGKKLKILTPLILSTHRRAQLIAIEHVAQVGWMDAVPLLVELLDHPDEELVLAVLSALRFLPSRTAMAPIMKFLDYPNDEVRFRAILALGVIYEVYDQGLRHVLIDQVGDKSPRVRQAAVWSLRRKPLRRTITLLIHLSAHDADPVVRQEALSGLQPFPTVIVIRHLLDLLMAETDRMVALRCESVLLGMDHEALLDGLEHVVKKSTGSVRRKAILLSAEFQRGSERYYRFLIKGLKLAKDDRDKVVYIEALGGLGDVRAARELLPYLQQSPVVAYVAMASLLKVSDETWPFLAYLESPDGAPLLKQMVLRYLIRRDHLVAIHKDRLEKCLLTFLEGDNINMRYLAAQVLVGISSTVAQEALLKTIQIETDPTSLRLLRNSLVDFFTKDPAGYVAFLHDKRQDAAMFETLCAMLKQLIWNGVDVIAQLPHLFSYELVETGDRYVACCSEWLAEQLIAGRVKMDDVLRTLEHTVVMDVVLQKITSKISEVPNLRLAVSSALLWRRLEEGSDIERGAVIELMGMAHSQSSLPVLVSVICNDRMEKFHDQASRALARITQDVV